MLNYFKKFDVVKLENDFFNFLIVFGVVHGRLYEGFQKIPRIIVLIICHWNLNLYIYIYLFI